MMNLDAPRPRLPALTSLRFFAALHVVCFHFLAFKIVSSEGWLGQISSIGYVGVSFFFVLSGFILVYTYAGRDTPARDFWRARFARIYPAFAFSLLLTGPFFFFATLMLNVPFFAWFFHAPEISGAAGAISTASVGAARSPGLEFRGLEPFR
jgi:peptidoglycan/LPS O-acetylase OafA/YrhL